MATRRQHSGVQDQGGRGGAGGDRTLSDRYRVRRPTRARRRHADGSEPVSTGLIDYERECGWSMRGSATVHCPATV